MTSIVNRSVRLGVGCTVSGCQLEGTPGFPVITITGEDNLVDGNRTRLGTYGVQVSASGGTNVIIRNLTIKDSTDDNLGLLFSQNVWVDHCAFMNSKDGNVDIGRASDNITISWCKFFYETPQDHALACLLGSSDADRVEREILAMTSHHPSVPPAELLPQWSAWRRSRPMTKANVLRQLRAAAAFRAPEAPPGMPVLVLASTRDGLVNPACSIRMADAWHAELALHPTAGHDLPLDDPQWVVHTTRSWMERQVPAG